MSISTSRDLRCPQCAAQVPPAVDWCTLCFASLRDEEPPPPAAVPVAAPAAREDSQPAAETEVAETPRRRGKHAKPEPVESADGPPLIGGRYDEDAADAMLAQLAASEAGGIGQIADHVGSGGRKAAIGFFGALLATLVIVLLMLVLGALA